MLRVLRHRNFALLWLAGLISNAGDWALAIALPAFVYNLTGSVLSIGSLVLAQSLPRLLVGLVAGALVDRWDRRRTMVAADLARAATLPLVLLVHSPDALPLLYAVAACEAALSLLFAPAQAALLPRLVEEVDLLAANSLRAVGWELTRLGAPPLGGLLMGVYGLPIVVLLNSASFLFSAGLVGCVAAPGGPITREAEGSPIGSGNPWVGVWRDLLVGLRSVVRAPLLRAVIIVSSLGMVGEGVINVLGFPWIVEVLGGGATERGWLATAQALGGIAGGLGMRWLERRAPPGRAISLGAILFGALSLALANIGVLAIGAPYLWPLALLLKGLSGVPLVMLFVRLETLLVRGSEDLFRGRIFAAYSAANAFALVIGQALAAVLGGLLGIVPVLSLQGALYLVAGLAALILIPRYAGGVEPSRGEADAPTHCGSREDR